MKKVWGYLEQPVRIGVSVNIEITFQGVLPDCSLRIGEKNIVKDIRPFQVDSETEHGRVYFEVTLVDSKRIIVSGKNPKQFVAGSSANVAKIFHRLGFKDFGLVAPIGKGWFSTALRNGLNELNRFEILVGADPVTLTIRNSDDVGSTLLCKKPYHSFSDSDLRSLSETSDSSRMNIMTSIKDTDLDFVRSCNLGFKKPRKGCIDAFIPHALFLETISWPRELRQIIKVCHVVQMNNIEASIFLDQEFGEHCYDKLLEEIGEGLVIVTMGDRGAVLLQRGEEPLVTPAYQASSVVDTCGAGDTFFATFLYFAYLYGMDKDVLINNNPNYTVAMKMATWLAGCSVEQVGPGEGLPSKEEIDLALQKIL